MTRTFDKILLGLLWLMTVALATTFWMNIRYGFNIFSAAHWEYLSSLQANRLPIDFGFYMSLVIFALIALIGLYILVHPRSRKIKSPSRPPVQKPKTATIPINPRPVQQVQQPQLNTNRPLSPNGGRPILLQKSSPRPTPAPVITPPTTIVQSPQNQNPLGVKIEQIFKINKYIIKPCKKIDALYNPIVAVGYDQSLWIASSGITFDTMRDAITTILSIFEDTLGDSTRDMITIHGCIINNNINSEEIDIIKTFKNISEFEQYVNEHPNIKDEDFDSDLFEAMSTYISTVLTHIGKQ